MKFSITGPEARLFSKHNSSLVTKVKQLANKNVLHTIPTQGINVYAFNALKPYSTPQQETKVWATMLSHTTVFSVSLNITKSCISVC